MNLYYCLQTVNDDYDTWDSMVVAARDELEAQTTSPSVSYRWIEEQWWFCHDNGSKTAYGPDYTGWAHPKDVKVEYIGKAKAGTEAGVICASFNAG